MKIQIVTNDHIINNGFVVSDFNSVKTFDSFDYNVIDLGSKSIWVYEGNLPVMSNERLNLVSISKMIKSSKKARYVFVFPRNLTYLYDYNVYHKEHEKGFFLKNNIDFAQKLLIDLINFNYSLEYEPNITEINGQKGESDFYFNECPDGSKTLLKALDSEKITSFIYNNNAYTTIDVIRNNMVVDYINSCYDTKNITVPDWFNSLVFNDDKTLLERVEENERLIAEKESETQLIKEKLNRNNYYKMMLVANGEYLLKIVFDVIKQLFDIDLSSFRDVKKEDFSFCLDGNHFVGEIKGVNENVKRNHLSELEFHKQQYIDSHKISSAKGLLIINHQRNKKPTERVPVSEDHIEYAAKDNNLIIETTTFLDIYCYYLNGNLDIKKLKSVLLNLSGLLKDEWK